jgi:Domain of unknown function (DUF6471)
MRLPMPLWMRLIGQCRWQQNDPGTRQFTSKFFANLSRSLTAGWPALPRQRTNTTRCFSPKGGVLLAQLPFVTRVQTPFGQMPTNEYKHAPTTKAYEAKAKNLLKGELKRRGLTYAQLAEKLAAIGVDETERNLNNKISRGASRRRSCFNA